MNITTMVYQLTIKFHHHNQAIEFMVQSSPPNTTYNNTNKRSHLSPPMKYSKLMLEFMPTKSMDLYCGNELDNSLVPSRPLIEPIITLGTNCINGGGMQPFTQKILHCNMHKCGGIINLRILRLVGIIGHTTHFLTFLIL
jgi:hypothetical protein